MVFSNYFQTYFCFYPFRVGRFIYTSPMFQLTSTSNFVYLTTKVKTSKGQLGLHQNFSCRTGLYIWAGRFTVSISSTNKSSLGELKLRFASQLLMLGYVEPRGEGGSFHDRYTTDAALPCRAFFWKKLDY